MELKYPLPLTESDRATLSNFLERARSMREADLAAEQKKRKAQELKVQLTAKVSALEKRFADGDLDCLPDLTSQKAQLSALSGNIPSPHSPAPNRQGLRDPYYGLMMMMHDFIRPFLLTARETFHLEIVKSIRRFCFSDHQAEEKARGMTAQFQCFNFIERHLNPGNPTKAAALLAATAEKLLAGDVLWTFDPNIKS